MRQSIEPYFSTVFSTKFFRKLYEERGVIKTMRSLFEDVSIIIVVLIDKNYMKGCTEGDELVRLFCEISVLVDWNGT